MPESRDRRSKPVDIAAVFARRRSGIIGVLDDEVELGLFGSTTSRVTTASTAAGAATGLGVTRAGGVIRGSFGTPSPSRTARRGRSRPPQSVLPSWYPRTPLRDIAAVVRVMSSLFSLSIYLFVSSIAMVETPVLLFRPLLVAC